MLPPYFFKSSQSGFTILEMLVVTTIFTIMTGVVLANLPRFREKTSLELVAQEVSLVIRQAQAFGSITRAAPVGSDPLIFPSYGIHFNLTDSGMVEKSDTQFTFFADRPAGTSGYTAGKYDYFGGCGNVASECREVFNLTGGITMSSLSLCEEVGTPSCSTPAAGSIIFQRPDPEAILSSVTTSGSVVCADCSYAKLRLTRNGLCADVYVWRTGHIYSQMLSPDQMSPPCS